MTTLHDMAFELRAKTRDGAVLMFDGELWNAPRWRINKNEVSFSNSGCRIILWSSEEGYGGQAEAIRVIRKRIRVLVDA